MALPFLLPSSRGNAWFSVGLASSFPNLNEPESVNLSQQRLNDGDDTRPCRVFIAPSEGGDSEEAVRISDDPKDQMDASLRRGGQVLVFQYRGKFHAIDNVHEIAPPGSLSLTAPVLILLEMPALIVPTL